MECITRMAIALLIAWTGCELHVQAIEIHLQRLSMQSPPFGEVRSDVLLPDEISGVRVQHVALAGSTRRAELLSTEVDSVFLFIQGRGKLVTGATSRTIESETIALPISYAKVQVEAADGDTLHYLRIDKTLSPEDLAEAQELSPRSESKIYFKKFSDCQAYREKIKSSKTVSRTVLPQNYAPRLAMGTVETTGPDAVGAHEHPMLDQLFLGLAGNDSVVYADDAKTRFPAFTLLHIPLGSRHWVEVEEGRRMYYMWMDFFTTKEGLEWLKTHKHVDPSPSAGTKLDSASVRREYVVKALPDFEVDASAADLPDLSPYTFDSTRQLAPADRDGKAMVGLASGMKLLEESFRRERGRDLERRQGTDQPRVIYIDGGALTLSQVAEQINDAKLIENRGGVVTARLPLVIKPGATLIIDGRSTPRFQLSTDRGAFLANAGQLFVLDTVVTSWSEPQQRPTIFVAKDQFRPFISSYIRSKTYVAGCKIEHLGFGAPTAYGFSLSSHPERERGEPREDWPTGVIVGNVFRGMYYGFYSYEARDVAIVDNHYIGSIVYGIDPHDRSTRLIIAQNKSNGTVERHGIIGSRGISDSFIFENEAYDNAGSGIMLDRQCTRNVICNNRVFRNGQGVAIYESPENLIRDNLIAFNQKSGVRVRNSSKVRVLNNTLAGNSDYALEVSAKRLDDHAKRFARGDKYHASVSVEFHGNAVGGEGGIAKGKNFDRLRLSSIRQDTDLSEIAAQLGVDLDSAPAADLASFGQELKPLADQLKRVVDEEGLVLEIAETKTP